MFIVKTSISQDSKKILLLVKVFKFVCDFENSLVINNNGQFKENAVYSLK